MALPWSILVFFIFFGRNFIRKADGIRILEEFQSHPDSLYKNAGKNSGKNSDKNSAQNSWSRWLWLIPGCICL